MSGDAELIDLSQGKAIPVYRSPTSARKLLASIADPFRPGPGAVIRELSFFGLSSDSATDRGAKKEEPVYCRTALGGRSHTAFLRRQRLTSGTAAAVLSSYKRGFSNAGIPVEQWIGKSLWYCADRASVMQGVKSGVATLLQQ